MAIHIGGQPDTYAGAVLATRERNYHDDSDFYAVVWDEASGCCRDVGYATTRCGGGGSAQVDATPEVRRKARRWQRKRFARALREALTLQAAEPDVGKRVRVKRKVGKGRIPAGSEGVVLRREANPFRTYYRNGYNRASDPENQRVLVEFDLGPAPDQRGRWWCSLKGCEVVDPEPVCWRVLRARSRGAEDGYEVAFARAGMAVVR